MMKGYIHIYMGNGKGKTTAALGLVMRAAGAGFSIFFSQFLKKGNFSEVKTLKRRFPEISLKQYGAGRFIRGRPSAADIQAAKKGLVELRNALRSNRYQLVIADELNTAVSVGLVSVKDVLQIINEKPPQVELVITGRGTHRQLIRRADLVTEMKCVKHYFKKGIVARTGIEK